jgi:hypothetical protein
MSFFEQSLIGREIHSVHIDSEITYIMLTNGTQVTIRGLVAVQPAPAPGVVDDEDRTAGLEFRQRPAAS